jgi:hypothetical protein
MTSETRETFRKKETLENNNSQAALLSRECWNQARRDGEAKTPIIRVGKDVEGHLPERGLIFDGRRVVMEEPPMGLKRAHRVNHNTLIPTSQWDVPRADGLCGCFGLAEEEANIHEGENADVVDSTGGDVVFVHLPVSLEGRGGERAWSVHHWKRVYGEVPGMNEILPQGQLETQLAAGGKPALVHLRVSAEEDVIPVD